MASPPLPVEDQTDEDFFDKLVEDEGDATGSSLPLEEHAESDDVHAVAKLRISEVGTSEDGLDNVGGFEGTFSDEGVKNDVGSLSVDPNCDNGGPAEAAAVESLKENGNEGTDESGNHVKGVDGADIAWGSKVCSGERNVGGVKEVQWSAFNSDSNGGMGNESYSDFFGGIEGKFEDSFAEVDENTVVGPDSITGGLSTTADNPSLRSYVQHDENLSNGVCTENTLREEIQNGATNTEYTSEVQDVNSIQYWESLYPGWKYDQNTGQWYQVDGSGLIGNNQENCNAISQPTGEANIGEQQSDVYYLQQIAQSSTGNAIHGNSSENVAYWNQTSGETYDYPPNMVFDPQYPGWYYDTIAQEWRSLESYTASLNQVQSLDHSQLLQNGNAAGVHYQENLVSYNQHGHNNHNQYQEKPVGWGSSVNGYNQQTTNVWKTQSISETQHVNFSAQSQPINGYVQSGNTQDSVDKTGITASSAVTFATSHGFDGSNGNYRIQNFVPDQAGSVNSREAFVPSAAATSFDQNSQGFNGRNGISGYQSFVPAQNFALNHNTQNEELSYHRQFSPTSFNGADFLNFSRQPLERGSQIPYTPAEGRSPDGRPLHALVAFGFGGKLIVMKDHLSVAKSSFGNQDSAGGVVNILNLMDVLMPKSDGMDMRFTGSEYFLTLCHQFFPGPLVSGNVGSKELNKWIDDEVVNSGIQETDYAKSEVTRMLFSLLKIACQYYGKLRTPFGTDHALKESDCPESALAKLFASAKSNGAQFAQFSALTNCLRNLPSEEQVQATALEVEKLLVTGRRIEALQCAQEGQLWGPALVIAAQLGDQFYGDTVKQMAINQLGAGCPLRTLCLLIAGKPAEVFSNSSTNYNQLNFVNSSQLAQLGSNCMLDKWEENLAIITANRTQGDELVITHLGDCLWKERGEVTAAHICYLVAEANIEPYSDSARLCLIGSDHWKNPRTYATPEAIQRTELFEYAKVLGNSQFILLPFQPYKVVYASMLAEVGKLSDSLKYCQAILKCLKNGRAPEVDVWRNLVSSLEERIKIHQQGGYAGNLAPAKLVGKLLNFFDNTAQRVVGLSPPGPSASTSNGQHNENEYHSRGNRVSASQSTVAMSSLASSASLEPVNEWSGSNNRKLHNRSISEPDMGRTPRKVHSPEKSTSDSFEVHSPEKSTSAAPSRLGRFGSQLFQKTVGLVLRTRSDRQAKLGETNKFYYDEKLKKWVEEGAEPPAEETALPPPPTAAFLYGMPDQHINDGSATATLHANSEPQFSPESTERSSVMPPISPAMNQFSSRGRMGVRARYVDTFNKGGGASASSFQSPSVPAAKPAGFNNAKFFVPTPVPAGEESTQVIESKTEASTSETTSTLPDQNSSSPMPSESHTSAPTVPMQRYPSEDNLVTNTRGMLPNSNSSPLQPARRTASWSGANYGDFLAHPNKVAPQPLGETLGFPSKVHMPNEQVPRNAGEDLHEVEL